MGKLLFFGRKNSFKFVLIVEVLDFEGEDVAFNDERYKRQLHFVFNKFG